MSLECYLDDSGNKDDPIITLAGYVSLAQNWRQFETDAQALFGACELSFLHTVDLHQRKGQFKGWTRAQTAEFANDFYGILDRHAYAGFEFSVLKSTFETKKSVYNVEHRSSPLGFCFHGIVHRLIKDEGIADLLTLPGVTLSFVVESGNKNEEEIRLRFKSIQRQDPTRLTSMRFVRKRESIALQAADFLAYFCRRLRTRDRSHKRYMSEVEFLETAKGGMLHRHFLATDFEG